MSLINQVLNDLDKRGASTNIGEATIRVVPLRSRRSAFLLVAAGAAGALGVGVAAWLVWQAQRPSVAPAPRVVAVPVAAIVPASQPVAASAVQVAAPRIDSVTPSPVPALAAAQTITIRGSNFGENASVTLRKEGGRAYTDRPLVSLAPDRIVLKSKFGRKPHSWTVEVVNADGHASGEYTFEVQAAAAPAPQVIGKPLADIAAAPAADTMPVGKGVNKHPTQLSKQQQADNEFRAAYQLMRQGRNSEAQAGFETALKLDPGHELARRTLVGLLLEKKRVADAE
ncbi:MAG TPA: tetratricopeptide repeat protein, partial [Gallionellaceae bacterium]|nr:tetratricopeptide repeat protein [Gallionellaceae bacterium]